jgi:hypothetical protein
MGTRCYRGGSHKYCEHAPQPEGGLQPARGLSPALGRTARYTMQTQSVPEDCESLPSFVIGPKKGIALLSNSEAKAKQTCPIDKILLVSPQGKRIYSLEAVVNRFHIVDY